MKKYFASSELIINEDGSVFHLHVKPEWLADKVILVGDPGRVALVLNSIAVQLRTGQQTNLREVEKER